MPLLLPSVRGIASSHQQTGPQDNLEVQDQRSVIDVPQIAFDASFHILEAGCFASVSVDLRPTGQARFDVMTECIVGNLGGVDAVVRHGVGRGPTKDM